MNDIHMLLPCALCPDRMAVPGSVVCTICDVELTDLIPDDVSELFPRDEAG
jgi:hypothetical protein